MGIPDFAFNLSLRNKSSNRVNDNKIDCPRTRQDVYDFKCLLTSVRL